MNKSLKDLDLNLNLMIDLIDSNQILTFDDWMLGFSSFLSRLDPFEFSIIIKYINSNAIVHNFFINSFSLPSSLWANLNIKDSIVSLEIIDPPYKFISVQPSADLERVGADLSISTKVKVYQKKGEFGVYNTQEQLEDSDTWNFKIDKTVAACLVVFSLQFPSSLVALGQVDSVSDNSYFAMSLLKENYETLQKTKNKKYIPLLKNMYKLNELSSKNHYSKDEKIEKYEKMEMIDHVADLINSFYVNSKPKKKNAVNKVSKQIAKKVLDVSKSTEIDYRILLSIIKEESNFDQSATNESGDFSLAQINYGIWNAELQRLKEKPIVFEKLHTDINYSLDIMGKILTVLKKSSDKDPLWFAKYHSKTPSKKLGYAQKLNKHFKHFNQLESEELQNTIIEYNFLLSSLDKEELHSSGIDEYRLSALNTELSSMLVHFNNSKVAYNED